MAITPGVPAPPVRLADLPDTATGEFATCTEGTQVALIQYTHAGVAYRLIYAPLTRAWLVVAHEAERVWLGTASEAGVLTIAHALTLEEARTQYPDPCVWLEREST